jgi:type IV pilus assembly protein PilV
MNTFTLHRLHRTRGFTLVEALVALVVLSIGMLGIAALYVESLRAGRTALIRSQAVTLASDMADRIRANRAGGITYDKDVDDAGTLSGDCEQDGASASCTPAVMADHDKAIWDAEVIRSLPAGTAQIEFTDANLNVYVITVTWAEQDATVSYVMRIEA